MEDEKSLSKSCLNTNLENYTSLHVHSHFSNVISPDVVINEFQLAERAKELNMTHLALTDHGSTIGKLAFQKACSKYGIKPIFGMEGYFVKDINEIVAKKIKVKGVIKDSEGLDDKNGHILFLAKNKEGLRSLNRLMSDSFEFGFYKKPRVDINLIRRYLSPKNIIISTACVGSFVKKYGVETISLFQDFIDEGSFYIEFQSHNNSMQKEYSEILLDYSIKNNIPTIVTNDTHAVDERSAKLRMAFLKSKGIEYEEEEGGWYVDFPSIDELRMRFEEQGILSKEVLDQSIINTNKIRDQIEDFNLLEHSFRVPVLSSMDHMTIDERVLIFKNIIETEFLKYVKKKDFTEKDIIKYREGIDFEVSEIVACGMSDYFVMNYEIVKLAIKKYGGVLTKTSRGSASCFFINFLLGFTAMDRFIFDKLPLFPERFLTAERVLSAKTPPDIDYNVADPNPFIMATKELIGETHSYPMIALGLYRVKSSWKLFSRINKIDPEISNTVSKSIDSWNKAMQYADDDEKDNILIEDFIPEDYLDIFNESKDTRSIVDNIKPHPCGVTVSSVDLRSEFGLMKVGRGENKVLCVAAEGNIEKLGFVKNDYLVVSIVDILDKIYKKIGIPQHTPEEIVKLADENREVYDIYTKGTVAEVNQMTSPRTVEYLAVFKPASIYDLSTVVAQIRPGAMSTVDRMMNRKPYTYNIREIDDLLSGHTGSEPAVSYQESIMSLLSMAGFPIAETYTCLKAISKKDFNVISSIERPFKKGLSKKLGVDESNPAIKNLWQQIIDSAAYAFNAPHSLATALDSLYLAYLKTFYPDETYSVLLDYYLIGKKRKIDKVAVIKKELESLGYIIKEIKYGQDNRDFLLDQEQKIVTQSMLAMKSSNIHLADSLSNSYNTNIDCPFRIYEEIKKPKNPATNRAYNTKRHWDILCKVNYFEGNNKKLELLIPVLHNKVVSKKQFRLSSLIKLKEELKIDFNILPYCSKTTAKTFYLDENKKYDLARMLFDKIDIAEYTVSETVRNQIQVFGFLSNPAKYTKDHIFAGTVVAVSRKNNSLLIKTISGKDTWIGIDPESLKKIKRKQTIVIFKVKKVNKFGKASLLITDHLAYN